MHGRRGLASFSPYKWRHARQGTYDCSVDTPQTREFVDMQLCQLEELYSQYDFSEIWFDGGAPCLPAYGKPRPVL